MTVSSWPAMVLFCEKMQGGPAVEQFGSSPSNSLLAWLNPDIMPLLVMNLVGEPQQMFSCEAPGPICCTRFFASIAVIILDRLVVVNVSTPPMDVHDRVGKPPPVAVSTSLADPALAIANPEVPASLTVPVWQG